MRAKLYGFELDLGLLRPGQLLECRRTNDDGAMAVPAGPVQQRGGGLNQTLPDTGLVFLNNRTPDCFQRFVREPKLAAVKEIPCMLEIAAPFIGRHRPSAISHLRSAARDRKSTRLNSSHGYISYAVFCLKKKKKHSY